MGPYCKVPEIWEHSQYQQWYKKAVGTAQQQELALTTSTSQRPMPEKNLPLIQNPVRQEPFQSNKKPPPPTTKQTHPDPTNQFARLSLLPKSKIRKQPLWSLTTDEESHVDNALNQNGDMNEIIASAPRLFVYRKNFLSLRSGKWLSDEIINFYLSLVLRDHNSRRGKKKHSYIFPTLFMETYVEKKTFNYKSVANWTKKIGNLFEFEKLFFPVNPGQSHWTCVVVFLQECRIQYCDSYSSSGSRYLIGVYEYLNKHHIQTKGTPLPGEWSFDDGPELPRLQTNVFDCGLFCCSFVEFLLNDIPLTFTQNDMERRRKHIALAILKAGVHQPWKIDDGDDSDDDLEMWVAGER
jgi:sentrin-specific protease 1